MHILIGLIVTIGTIAWWILRLSRGARQVMGAAETVSGLHKKIRDRKARPPKGFETIQGPVDAATLLMVSVAQRAGHETLREAERTQIARELLDHMALEPNNADAAIQQAEMEALSRIDKQQTLIAMTGFLKSTVTREESRQLARMLGRVADAGGRKREQLEYIRQFQERMGLLG